MATPSSRVSAALELAAWVAGGALVLTYAGAEWYFARSKEAGLQAFAAARQAKLSIDPGFSTAPEAPLDDVAVVEVQAAPATSLRVAQPDTSSWSSGRISAYQAQDDFISPQAVLRIPSIDLEVPVYAGVTEENLSRGAAWIDTTSALDDRGNAGIASHRDGYFRALRGISLGDRIELQTLVGSYVYAVDDIRIVDPRDVHVLGSSSERMLTLVTCYPFYMVGPAPKRFVVRAHAASTRNPPQSYASTPVPSAM